MTLKLTLFSQEVEDFVLEIFIDSDAKFTELHRLILDDCNYDEHEKQCFLICDEEWRVQQRVCLHDSEDVGYDEDLNLMARTTVGDFLEDEGQRLAYIFDPDGKRFFLMELTEIIFGRTERMPIVNRRHGIAPLQNLMGNDHAPKENEPETEPDEDIEETFYGDDGYEADELDMEGYGIDE